MGSPRAAGPSASAGAAVGLERRCWCAGPSDHPLLATSRRVPHKQGKWLGSSISAEVSGVLESLGCGAGERLLWPPRTRGSQGETEAGQALSSPWEGPVCPWRGVDGDVPRHVLRSASPERRSGLTRASFRVLQTGRSDREKPGWPVALRWVGRDPWAEGRNACPRRIPRPPRGQVRGGRGEQRQNHLPHAPDLDPGALAPESPSPCRDVTWLALSLPPGAGCHVQGTPWHSPER